MSGDLYKEHGGGGGVELFSVKMYTSLTTYELFPEFFINILQEFLSVFCSLATEKKRKRGVSSLTEREIFLRGTEIPKILSLFGVDCCQK
jgi:hypothetical protein